MACAKGCCDTQREHYKSIVFGSVVTKEGTKAFDSDMDAYKRLRGDGVQPAAVEGSAFLERTASTVAQAESRPEGTLPHTASLAQLQEWEP